MNFAKKESQSPTERSLEKHTWAYSPIGGGKSDYSRHSTKQETTTLPKASRDVCQILVKKLWKSRFPLILFMLMVANLAYMHYEVYFLRNHFPGIKPYYTPLVFAGFDVMMVLMAFSLVSFKKRCISYTLSYIFILLVTVLNIGYSRFFHQYITVGAFHEVSNLTGTWWLQYVRDGLKLKDLSLLL